MQKLLSAMTLLLMSWPTFAATKEMEGAPSAPPETVSVVWVVIFGIIFIGSIIGFFVYLWWSGKKKKPDQ